MAGAESANTFRLLGQLQKKKVLMLVNSRSCHCFVSQEVAATLNGTEQEMQPIQAKIADGGVLTYNKELIGCEWWC